MPNDVQLYCSRKQNNFARIFSIKILLHTRNWEYVFVVRLDFVLMSHDMVLNAFQNHQLL
jgi:hypothetical protein